MCSETNCCDVEQRSLLTTGLCRSRSKAEFISKMNIVVEEADESVFWLELLSETGVVRKERLSDLPCEANELLAICAASLRTAKQNRA
jgi:four helix bundle protein